MQKRLTTNVLTTVDPLLGCFGCKPTTSAVIIATVAVCGTITAAILLALLLLPLLLLRTICQLFKLLIFCDVIICQDHCL